jgi:membrane protein
VGRLRRIADALMRSVPGRVLGKFGEDRGSHQAIVIAWNLLFSVFPIALVTAGILGLVVRGMDPATVYAQVVNFIPDPQSQSAALTALEGVREQTGLFLVIGLAGLAWSGSALFGAMDEIFAYIYREQPRGIVQQRVMSLAMMLIFTLLTALAVSTSFLSTVLRGLPILPGLVRSTVFQYAVGTLSAIVLFGVIYLVVPNLRLRLRQALPGALLAGIAFKVLSVVFPIFLDRNRGINQYGRTFTLLFVLLTFFYFVGLITVMGAELNAVLTTMAGERRARAAEEDHTRKTGQAQRRAARTSGP